MPSFDVVSETDMQEVRNACDQAAREVATRFDFKNTKTAIELGDDGITIRSATEDRLKAARQVLEEKLVKRKVSLKAVTFAAVEEASGGSARQTATISQGIDQPKAKEIGKHIKAMGLKGVQHQIQGDQLRVSGKKRDALQDVIADLKSSDFGIPLQYVNFRD